MDSNKITHEGMIIDQNESLYIIEIHTESACSGCHAKAVCNPSEYKKKHIEVYKRDCSAPFKIGERVTVTIDLKGGMLAVILSFIVPTLLLFLSLGIGQALHKNELQAGALALGLLTAYFFIIFLARKKIKRRMVVQMQKMAL